MTVADGAGAGSLFQGSYVGTPGYYTCQEMVGRGELTKVSEGIDPAEGATVENKYIVGGVTISHNHVTLNHDCVSTRGTEAINVECGAEYAKVENSDIFGEDATANLTATAVSDDCAWQGNHQLVVLEKDAMWNCTECLHGNFEATNSFVLTNGELPNGEPNHPHTEDAFINQGDPGAYGLVAFDHDTLLNPSAQTAIVFAAVRDGTFKEPCENVIRITNSLLSGSGQMLQFCGAEASAAGGEIKFTGNRIARCIQGIEGSPARCRIPGEWRSDSGAAATIFGEEYGYFPHGAANYPGELLGCEPSCPTGSSFAWTGNYWDDDLEVVASSG